MPLPSRSAAGIPPQPPSGGPSGPPGPGRTRLLVAVVLLLAALVTLIFPASASALASTGHGVGYVSKADGVSWIGTYRLADGRLAFCLEAGKASPVGNDYDLTTGSTALGLSKADIGRLAYIARTWSTSTDPTIAAGAQLAVWSISGLNGHTQAWYAARANEARDAVLAKARSMLAQASANATTSAKAAVTVKLGADGSGKVKADLTKTLVTGATAAVAASTRTGTITLTGAKFVSNGTATRSVKNGEFQAITPTGTGVSITVRATARFEALPFDAVITVGSSSAGSQTLLFTPKAALTVSASQTGLIVSPRPFQPTVQTKTSSVVAAPGATISDSLKLAVAPGDGLLSSWGVYGPASSTLPVPVTIRSSLLGPFGHPLTESATWPEAPPVVCEVSVVARTGPGSYRTPECTIPSAGYYVWVETIDPADTPADQGRDRVKPWKSPFASATEVTRSPASPAVQTSVKAAEGGSFAPGSCVVDELDVSGLGSGVLPEVDVESTLLGPFDDAPEDGHDFGADDPESLPVAGRVTTRVTADGEYETPCLEVSEPGHYVFVFRSEGSEPDADGSQIVPAFADLVAHTSEMLAVPEPEEPDVPDVPQVPGRPDVPSKPDVPAAPHRLAFTGSEVGPTALAAAGALSVGAAAVLGTLVARFVRRRRDAAGAAAATSQLPDDVTTVGCADRR